LHQSRPKLAKPPRTKTPQVVVLAQRRLRAARMLGRMLTFTDRALSSLDSALRTVSGAARAARPVPPVGGAQTPFGNGDQDAPSLSEADRRLSGAMMRVNHVGEVCAQALYQAQALTARSPQMREQMLAAAREETDHLTWTQERLRELNDRPSWLNPLWYAGAFTIGLVAGRLGDAASLGFVVETERQVEAHLASHLERLPAGDAASRAIVEQMKQDEARHADEALAAGAAPMPEPVKWLMKASARVMTTVAHRV
jgi:ubiquinone biosynthesis monooxygenase Coq7